MKKRYKDSKTTDPSLHNLVNSIRVAYTLGELSDVMGIEPTWLRQVAKFAGYGNKITKGKMIFTLSEVTYLYDFAQPSIQANMKRAGLLDHIDIIS